ncbi:MAG TPA: exostosin family protein [Gaiellaceae bacterium]|nr:exostosin family protein [Gaiellaceae bacterium]
MRVFIATAVDASWSGQLRSEWRGLASRDRFGVHELVDAAGDADLILVVDLHQYPSDWSMRAVRDHALVRAYPERTFVYDERDLPRDLLPGVYVAMPRRRFDPRRQRAFGYPRLVTNTRPAREKTPDLLFSFQGRRAGRVRGRVLALSHPRAIVEDSSALDFFGEPTAAIEDARRRYLDVVGRSKFVLCPRGAGAASIRLFETLAAGRVPVVISDDWVPPAGIDWDTCSVRLRERDVTEVAARLEALEGEWEAMSAAARSVYDEWFAPDVWFHRVIELCAELRAGGRLGPASLWTQLGTWRAAARHLRGRR